MQKSHCTPIASLLFQSNFDSTVLYSQTQAQRGSAVAIYISPLFIVCLFLRSAPYKKKNRFVFNPLRAFCKAAPDRHKTNSNMSLLRASQRLFVRQRPVIPTTKYYPLEYLNDNCLLQFIACQSARFMSENETVSKEAMMADKLKRTFNTDKVVVEDVSGTNLVCLCSGIGSRFSEGGCGAQYTVTVESDQFSGLSSLKQNRLVSQALKDEIANMHAIRIFTSTGSN